MAVRVTKVLPPLVPAVDGEQAWERLMRIVGNDLRAAGQHRIMSFERGDEPLPAFSSLPPRRTGWEREWQQ